LFRRPDHPSVDDRSRAPRSASPTPKGTAAGVAYKDDVNGIKLNLIQLDDASDPSTGTRNARKLIEQDKVDVLMGAGSTPSSIAITAVCHELKVPCITLAPGEHARRARLLDDFDTAAADADGVGRGRLHEGGRRQDRRLYRLQRRLGRSRLWRPGKIRRPDGIKILTNERYARADTSVTAQALHIVAAAPDAVMTGGSGTPGALPFIALRERGYTKEIYGTPALINPDFVRVGGAAVEGVIASTGPVVVADQLP
jgi:branched-chain amino acid transport system substrate-binding protein